VEEQRQRLVSEFLALAAKERSVVVVSQTWGEIHQINERIREGLRDSGTIGKEDFNVTTHEKVDLTNAQKRDRRFYEPDSVLVFNRNVGGLKTGDTAKLLTITASHLVVEGVEKVGRISFDHLDRLTVCRPKPLALAEGDRLQLKANARTNDGREFVNGELVSVQRVDDQGRIRLKDGRTLPQDYRQFVRGYAVTSYGSQGKTVEHVLFSDSAVKAATNNQQWLVTISRGTRGVKVFTQDKEQLRENVSRLGDRELAIELGQSPPTAPSTSQRGHTGTHPAILRYVQRFIAERRKPALENQVGGRTWKTQTESRSVQIQPTGRRI
jgi:ATP-dependent exoDNAse (exonuclease V) alpha subunit